MLKIKNLSGQSFLDAGCGSGLFSLAAKRLGARVFSFDFDPGCVSCTAELKKNFYPEAADWTIQQASVLDQDFLNSLEEYDIVYSWGVLHHTGNMKAALDLVAKKVKPNGFLFIALANDQGSSSQRWLRIKRFYNRSPSLIRFFLVAVIGSFFELKSAVGRLSRGRNPLPFSEWTSKKRDRGMSVWHDWADWCGGYPFEVARPEDIIVPLRAQGLILENLKTQLCGWGCNEYVFRRIN